MRVAIVLPVHNEEPVVQKTLDALLAAGVDKKDLYVVDDASTDCTADIVKASGVQFLHLRDNQGKAGAQRKLIRYFLLCYRYDYLIFLDGDSIVEKEFLTEFKKAAVKYPEVSLRVGQVKSIRGNYLTALRAVEYAYGQDLHKSGQSNFGVVFVSPGCASMYKTETLLKLSIDSDTLAEDMDLTMQVQRLGEKIRYIPDAVVYTQDPNNLRDYIKQIIRWQRGGWQVFKKHRVVSWNKKQKVDWMIIFLVADAFLFNQVFWLGASVAFLSWETAKWAMLVNLGASFAMAVYAGLKTRRFDVVYKFPMYFWVSWIYLGTFLKTFYEVMIRDEKLLAWNKVARY